MSPTLFRQRYRAAAFVATLAMAGAAVLAATGSVLGASHDIAIVDFGFEPATQAVFVGEPVTWTNQATQDHTVTSDQGTELDGDPIGPGEAYGHVFEVPGTYAYHCMIHPAQMTGTITVTAAPATAVPSGSPEPTPPSGTLPPNFSPLPSTGPLESAPTATASADPGAANTGVLGPQFLVLVFVGAAVAALVALLILRRGRRAKT